MSEWDQFPLVAPAGSGWAGLPQNSQDPRPDLPVSQDDLDSPIPTQLLQAGRDILDQAVSGEPIKIPESPGGPHADPWAAFPVVKPKTAGADAMRARGFKSPDPAAANAIAAAGIQSAQDEAMIAANPVLARTSKVLQGVPFVGQWLDEGAGVVLGPEAQSRIRGVESAMERERPKESAALQLGGGVLGTLAALPAITSAAALTPAAITPTSLGMQTVTGLGLGAATGAGEGAVSGAGAANEGDRGEGARRGAIVGGVLGGGIGAAAPAVASGARSALSFIKGSDISTISSELGISAKAAKAVKAALDGEDLSAAAANLQRGGADAMLVEAGPSTKALGDAVATSGGEATRIMRDAIDNRTSAAAGRMQGVLDDALGKPSGRADLAANIRNAMKAARQKAYEGAYSTAIDYSSPAGKRVEELLSRVPPKTMAQAVRKASDRMVYDGMPGQILASVGDDGKVTFKEMPNAMQLDYIKRAFDDLASDGKDTVTGKLSSDASFAAKIARDVRNAHGAANPAYREALRTGADSIQAENAVEVGYKALAPSTTREAFRTSLSGMNADQRRIAKAGVRQYFDDAMANVRSIMSDPGANTDAREAVKALRDLSSRSARDKLTLLLGQDAPRLVKQADELATAFEIQAAMSTNSKTAIRQAVQGSVEKTTEPGPVGRLLSGEPINAAKRLAQIFTGATPEARDAAKSGIYAEIASALTQTKGQDARTALSLVSKAMKGQAVSEAKARYMARLVTSALGASAYRLGTQELQSP